ncbi:putative membrane protein YdjX (TVP38/TMEM64 family) [Rhodopseudomonas julia]|uniref:TVP38/TMEM64 family membrane protein n=1 Tax=Rhodopseudomonas julia TaxID=200617 RepID=A0ABU0C4J4_9BRAD|nr:TVP38/TMEM64 family protein [Rhodopseudomonas julia]MDQ0325142.1 putative membrane protein YdjX (TVP38/TMEM64 family) [Rhodopseudomonas julia]
MAGNNDETKVGEWKADAGGGTEGSRRDDIEQQTPGGAPRALWLRFLPVGIVALLLLLLYAAGFQEFLSLDALEEKSEALKGFVGDRLALSGLLYVIVYITLVAVSFPGASIVTIAGGLLFGWVLGGALSAVGATIGACIIFLIARTSFGTVLARRAGPRLKRLRSGFQEDAFHYLLFLRLAPIFPFWVINLAPALFDMRLGPYALATFLGILPGTFAYSYFGEGVGTALDEDGPVVSTQLLAGFAVLALAALLPIMLKRWRARKVGRKT